MDEKMLHLDLTQHALELKRNPLELCCMETVFNFFLTNTIKVNNIFISHLKYYMYK